MPESVAAPGALVLVTVIISYFSIVIGELTAKRLAMQRAEAFALGLAPLVSGIATLARPLIWFLDISTNFLVRLLGGDPSQAKDQVSDEELRAMVSSSSTLGLEERSIVDEVFDAGERSLREVMVPRTEVDFLPEYFKNLEKFLNLDLIRKFQSSGVNQFFGNGGIVAFRIFFR